MRSQRSHLCGVRCRRIKRRAKYINALFRYNRPRYHNRPCCHVVDTTEQPTGCYRRTTSLSSPIASSHAVICLAEKATRGRYFAIYGNRPDALALCGRPARKDNKKRQPMRIAPMAINIAMMRSVGARRCG